MTEIAAASEIHARLHRLASPTETRLDTLLALHEALLEEAAANHHLGWRPAGGEALKYSFALDRERLRHFANYAYGGIGFELKNDFIGAVPSQEDPAPRITAEGEVLRQAQRQILQWVQIEATNARHQFPAYETQWAALMHEPADMGGLYLELNSATPPIRVSDHSARVTRRAPLLAALYGKAPASILEIGGGHGKFLRDCALLMPEAKLFLTDLPFNLILQARYLGEYFGDEVNLCLLADQDVNPDARINLVAPWRLDRIPGPVEMVANFLSFQHMDADNLNWYGSAIEDLDVGHIFHLNRLTKRDPYDFAADDYPFRGPFRPVHRTVTPTGTLRRADGSETTLEFVLELLSRT